MRIFLQNLKQTVIRRVNEMTTFLQLHLLIAYPPSNVNRDDLGRPKSAIIGGAPRLRISSQSLKRAWRTSSVFSEGLAGNLGTRTKNIGYFIEERAKRLGIDTSKIQDLAKQCVALFEGKIEKDIKSDQEGAKGKKKKEPKKKKDDLRTEQLIFIGTNECQAIDELLGRIGGGHMLSKEDLNSILCQAPGGVDVAMFGRMLAWSKGGEKYEVEAAVQVAHAFSVNKVTIEDDYFTAVDDFPSSREESDQSGAAHIGVSEFGSGVFYQYLCVDQDRLKSNLENNLPLARTGITGLVEAACTVSPSGKQNSFAHGSYVSYALAERGSKQPRTLASSFLKPISGYDILKDAVIRFQDTRAGFDQVFGKCADFDYELSVLEKKGTLAGLIEFASKID